MTASAPVGMGVIAMTTKGKIVAGAAMLLALALGWAAWPRGASPDAGAPQSDRGGILVAQATPPPDATKVAADAQQRDAVEAPAPRRPGTGTLVVRVLYPDEPRAGAGLTVSVQRDAEFRVGLLRAVTDVDGIARFEGLAPGPAWIHTNGHHFDNVRAEVRHDAVSEYTLTLQNGMTLTGIVVDGGGAPVGGALVETAPPGIAGADAEQVAVAAADGTFAIRMCDPFLFIGARAPGLAASPLHYVHGKPGGSEQVRIELSAPAGAVAGEVVGPDGKPVPEAVVRVGKGRTDCIQGTPQGEPLPAQVRTDADGRFVAIGVPVGAQPVMVRAAGLAPWSGTCNVAAGATASVHIALGLGVTCTGIVRAEDGAPARAVEVRSGDYGEFLQFVTHTAADGTFTLAGLPAGDIALAAHKERLGKAAARVHGEAGATVRCELQLSNGIALRGRAVDEDGKPVAEATVECTAEGEGPSWSSWNQTDKQGRFLVPDLPAGRKFWVRVSARDRMTFERRGIDPQSGELEVRLPRDTAPRAHITGRVLGADGRVVSDASVHADRYQPQERYDVDVLAADGSFSFDAPAGSWAVLVESRGLPTFHAGPKKLQPGETWDFGTISLVRGNTLVVHDPESEKQSRVAPAFGVTDSGEPKADYLVYDARGSFVCWLNAPAP
jgi:protocatechuate 3,4-dioxygenase beta subunit